MVELREPPRELTAPANRQNRRHLWSSRVSGDASPDHGKPIRFMTLANWKGNVDTELFAQTYESYGLATVRYPVLEAEAKVEPI